MWKVKLVVDGFSFVCYLYKHSICTLKRDQWIPFWYFSWNVYYIIYNIHLLQFNVHSRSLANTGTLIAGVSELILKGKTSKTCRIGEILPKWADFQFYFITKGNIYYIKHMQIQLFSFSEWIEVNFYVYGSICYAL